MFVGRCGELGKDDGEFNEPTGCCVDSKGLLYVADYYNHRIQIFDADGTIVRKWEGDGEETSQEERDARWEEKIIE